MKRARNSRQIVEAMFAKGMRMHKGVILSLLVATFAFPASGQTLEKFKLYNKCQPVALAVEDLSDDAKKINLTKEAIANSTESRLRSARIYDKNGLEYLYVRVGVVGNGLSIEAQFKKGVLSYGEFGMATTWEAGIIGTHGSSASSKGLVLSGLSELIDQFIAEYLRTNEKDCK